MATPQMTGGMDIMSFLLQLIGGRQSVDANQVMQNLMNTLTNNNIAQQSTNNTNQTTQQNINRTDNLNQTTQGTQSTNQQQTQNQQTNQQTSGSQTGTQTTQGTQNQNQVVNTNQTGTNQTTGQTNATTRTNQTGTTTNQQTVGTTGQQTQNLVQSNTADIAGLQQMFQQQAQGVTPDMLRAMFAEGAREVPQIISALGNAVGARAINNDPIATSLGDMNTRIVAQAQQMDRQMKADAANTAAQIAANTRQTQTTGTTTDTQQQQTSGTQTQQLTSDQIVQQLISQLQQNNQQTQQNAQTATTNQQTQQSNQQTQQNQTTDTIGTTGITGTTTTNQTQNTQGQTQQGTTSNQQTNQTGTQNTQQTTDTSQNTNQSQNSNQDITSNINTGNLLPLILGAMGVSGLNAAIPGGISGGVNQAGKWIGDLLKGLIGGNANTPAPGGVNWGALFPGYLDGFAGTPIAPINWTGMGPGIDSVPLPGNVWNIGNVNSGGAIYPGNAQVSPLPSWWIEEGWMDFDWGATGDPYYGG
jgi:hypothetical protein